MRGARRATGQCQLLTVRLLPTGAAVLAVGSRGTPCRQLTHLTTRSAGAQRATTVGAAVAATGDDLPGTVTRTALAKRKHRTPAGELFRRRPVGSTGVGRRRPGRTTALARRLGAAAAELVTAHRGQLLPGSHTRTSTHAAGRRGQHATLVRLGSGVGVKELIHQLGDGLVHGLQHDLTHAQQSERHANDDQGGDQRQDHHHDAAQQGATEQPTFGHEVGQGTGDDPRNADQQLGDELVHEQRDQNLEDHRRGVHDHLGDRGNGTEGRERNRRDEREGALDGSRGHTDRIPEPQQHDAAQYDDHVAPVHELRRARAHLGDGHMALPGEPGGRVVRGVHRERVRAEVGVEVVVGRQRRKVARCWIFLVGHYREATGLGSTRGERGLVRSRVRGRQTAGRSDDRVLRRNGVFTLTELVDVTIGLVVDEPGLLRVLLQFKIRDLAFDA